MAVMIFSKDFRRCEYKTKAYQNFMLNCGNIIRMGVEIDELLEEFIIHYFHIPNERKEVLVNSVLNKMKFEKKINLIKKICDNENTPIYVKSPLIKSLRFIQEYRNYVAHNIADTKLINQKDGKKYKIYFETDGNKYPELSDSVMKDINASVSTVHENIFKLDMILSRKRKK